MPGQYLHYLYIKIQDIYFLIFIFIQKRVHKNSAILYIKELQKVANSEFLVRRQWRTKDGGALGTLLPLGPISFIFMQFSGKKSAK